MMPYWHGNDTHWWAVATMAVGGLLFLALLVVAITVLTRRLRRLSPPPQRQASPEDLLAERFALGDIDEQQYHQRLVTLQALAEPTRAPDNHPAR